MTLDNLIEIKEWFPEYTTNKLIIAGPCSAENHKQVLDTAKEINNIDLVNLFRAGVWKPRTRPGNFEGIGEEALKWLQEVKQKTNLRVCTEVASKKHIELAAKYNVDVVWIGARTVSNPFLVQELAEVVSYYNFPVMIKNPIHPDVDLWIGAIERFYKSGIKKMAAIHRGFYPFEKTNLRNLPKWEIPIDLKTKYPNLPIINDPSHIAGNRNLLVEIIEKAVSINFDGLMIETHINPDVALSDSKQQITPSTLKNILNNIKFKNISDINIDEHKLDLLREKIDSIDKQMLELLSKRMNVVEQIGDYKKNKNIAVFQLRRWRQIIENRVEFGSQLSLNKKFIKDILSIIHKESIMIQINKKEINSK